LYQLQTSFERGSLIFYPVSPLIGTNEKSSLAYPCLIRKGEILFMISYQRASLHLTLKSSILFTITTNF